VQIQIHMLNDCRQLFTHAHQQTPQMQNEELNADHHKPGNQQPSIQHINTDEIAKTMLMKKGACSLNKKGQGNVFPFDMPIKAKSQDKSTRV